MKRMMLPGYNYIFDDKTGYFMRWGKTVDDDPDFAPIGPEIADIEISTVCHKGCSFCYKDNVAKGENMSLETFKVILDKMPSVLQVAFGIGDIDGNPDLWDIMRYCRSKNVVPNITINGVGITDEHIKNLVSLCGAVAVSNYGKNSCYGTVERLYNAGLKQVNIHQVLSKETKKQVLELIEDIKNDSRLVGLNAVVFLSLKQRGRGEKHSRISEEEFKEIIDICLARNISFGFDSCGANKFLKAIEGNEKYEQMSQFAEPCESTCFSSYINTQGKFYPCSFGEDGEGVDVVSCDNFLNDVWYNSKTIEFRNNLISKGRNCPLYEI